MTRPITKNTVMASPGLDPGLAMTGWDQAAVD